MRSFHKLVTAILGISFITGCNTNAPVPVGYEANTRIREWAVRTFQNADNSQGGLIATVRGAAVAGIPAFRVVLRSSKRKRLSEILTSSCRRVGSQEPSVRPNSTSYVSLVISSNEKDVYLDLNNLLDTHGPEVAKHKEEIRKLLLDAYREQEARKAAERKRYPWKKE